MLKILKFIWLIVLYFPYVFSSLSESTVCPLKQISVYNNSYSNIVFTRSIYIGGSSSYYFTDSNYVFGRALIYGWELFANYMNLEKNGGNMIFPNLFIFILNIQ